MPDRPEAQADDAPSDTDETDDTDEIDEDREVDRLYELPPKQFVAARDELSKRLRATDRDAADRVRSLTRPTKAAWALNLVAREAADDVAELRAAGAALREAQEQAMAGADDVDLRAAHQRRDDVVHRLVEAAVAHAGDGHRDAIEATARAASTDAEVGEQLSAGRLAKPAPQGTGLGDLASMLEAGAARRPKQQPDRRATDRLRRDLRRADQTVDRVREEVERAQARADRARADLGAAQARLDEHLGRRDRLREALADETG